MVATFKSVGAGKAYWQSKRHEEAQAEVLSSGFGCDLAPIHVDRQDVPCLAMCIMAYKGAKVGATFTRYTELKTARACGAPIPQSRCSGEIARRLVHCAADELREQDRQPFHYCRDMALTMDGRKGRIITRASPHDGARVAH
jgi:hypothetical protein